MIPSFDEHTGYLPPGIHKAAWKELEKRYVYNLARRVLFKGLKKLVITLKTAGCQTLYLDGSFITNKPCPNDYDATWEFAGVNNTIDPLLRDGRDLKAIKKQYGGDVFCSLPELGQDQVEFFQTDRLGVRKGIILIDLRQPL